jgi:DNA-binding XRE family transcriptional regulator
MKISKTKLLKNTIPLSDLMKNLTPEEKQFIEAEERYYYLVVELRTKRRELGLTQAELAKKARVPRTTITKIESGSRNATLETLMAIAQAMGQRLELRLV